MRGITAYFDESGHSSETNFVSIAAFAAEADVWSKFDGDWRRVLQSADAPYLHMREFAHSRGVYLGWDEGRRRQLLAGAVEAINANGLKAIGAAISVAEFRALSHQAQEAFQDPFFCCLQETSYGVALQGLHEPDDLQIRSVFSQQDEFGGKLRLLWDSLRAKRGEFEKLEPIEFADMREVPGLQAADVLAYELRHFYHLRQTKPQNKPRWPFQQIVRYQRRVLGASMLKYLPGWYLQLQATGGFDEAMSKIMSRPTSFLPLLAQLTPSL
jgi:hypothetical protein